MDETINVYELWQLADTNDTGPFSWMVWNVTHATVEEWFYTENEARILYDKLIHNTGVSEDAHTI